MVLGVCLRMFIVVGFDNGGDFVVDGCICFMEIFVGVVGEMIGVGVVWVGVVERECWLFVMRC